MKNLLKYILFLQVLTLTFAGCTQSERYFTWKNPIRSGIPGGIRDAQIVKDNDTYYLIGGCPPFWLRDGHSPGIRLLSSKDILNWKVEGMLIERVKLDSSVWFYDRWWAPEIHKINEKYYLLFNCNNSTKTHAHPHGTAVAVSEQITGPYSILTYDEPFAFGNDLTFFQDDDSTVYAFWNGSKRMFAARVDMERMQPVFPDGQDSPQIIFRTSPDTWDSIGIEGPYCIKHEGIYYLFYSSWSRGYEIGYATAEHPLGPWTKYNGNPVYGAQNPAVCERNGLPYTGNPENPFRAVGHNEIWIGPDGRLWISCHGILKEGNTTPSLVIDPIWFENGEIKTNGTTWTEQRVATE